MNADRARILIGVGLGLPLGAIISGLDLDPMAIPIAITACILIAGPHLSRAAKAEGDEPDDEGDGDGE